MDAATGGSGGVSAPWLGLLLGSQRRMTAPEALYAAVEAEAAVAVAAGLDVLVAPEHLHAEPYAMLRPWPLLAALRARLKEPVATVGCVIAGLSSVAQTRGDLATLRAVGDGRVGVALAAGYRPEDFYAAGRDVAERYALRAAMRAELVGEHWTWSAAGNERAARRAVEAGAAWYGAPTLSDRDATAVADAVGGQAVLRRDVLLGRDDADVAARWERWVAPKYGALARWGYTRQERDGGAEQVLAGTPAEVAEKLNGSIAAARPEGIVLRLCWPDMDAHAGLDHVAAFGADVAPAIELTAVTRRN
jgi:alkanesulfonate monooxygenase SsuD/methylene tetrahydromethanopterin reductase-like flavin-dependent oxidoreductase (luciferase family)